MATKTIKTSKNKKELKPKTEVKPKESKKIKTDKKVAKLSTKKTAIKPDSKKPKVKKQVSEIKKSNSTKELKKNILKKEINPFEENFIFNKEPVRYSPETVQWFEHKDDYKIIKQSLPNKYKIFLALVLTVVSMTTVIGASLWFNQIFPSKENLELKEIKEIEKEYVNISLTSIDAYSTDWAKANFNEQELLNSLVSGPSGDADSDEITNLEEFILATNPKAKVTYCPVEKCSDTDGALFKKGVHPISKTPFITPLNFVIEKDIAQNSDLLTSIIQKTNQQGLNFSYIYSLERSQVLNIELQEMTVSESQSVTLSSYQNKLKSEFNYLQDKNSFSLYLDFYKNDNPQAKTDVLKSQLQVLEGITAPSNFSEYHKINILIIKKLISISDFTTNLSESEDESIKNLNIEAIRGAWSDTFYLMEDKKEFE